MLKIKENVDLKLLEKFGFVGRTFQNGFIYRNCYVYFNGVSQIVIYIDIKLRAIEMGFDFAKTDDGLIVLFKLFNAGLVEIDNDN